MSRMTFKNESNEAVEYAHASHTDAVFRLNGCYEVGRGVPKDGKQQAGEWYKKAADLGQVDATFNLGLNHEKGFGEPKEKAVELAASLGAAAESEKNTKQEVGTHVKKEEENIAKENIATEEKKKEEKKCHANQQARVRRLSPDAILSARWYYDKRKIHNLQRRPTPMPEFDVSDSDDNEKSLSIRMTVNQSSLPPVRDALAWDHNRRIKKKSKLQQ